MRDKKEGRKKERSKQGQTNKAKQHSTPKAVTFPKEDNMYLPKRVLLLDHYAVSIYDV